MTERQKLIAQKLTANRQRWLLSAYLDALPAPVRTELKAARVLCEPDNVGVQRHSYVSPRGVGYEAPVTPPGFAFREFSWPAQLFAALADYPDRHDEQPAYLQPYHLKLAPGLSMSDVLGELPAIEVRFGWARQHFATLFEPLSGLALVSESFEAGIVIDVVIGYLQPNPNPNEEIYELGTWGMG